jgi:hypothetical protein
LGEEWFGVLTGVGGVGEGYEEEEELHFEHFEFKYI